LPGVLESLAPLLDRYGYVAIVAAVTVEGIGIPSFGETMLTAGAVYAGAGRLNIVVVGVIALLAAIIGDNIGYAIGRFGGWRLLRRYGHYVFMNKKRLDRVEYVFTRHGGKAIIIARFFEGLRQANGILAGATGMPWRRFIVFNTAGAALWVGVWASLGYVAGQHVGPVYEEFSRYSLYTLILTGVIILALIARQLLRRRAAIRKQAAMPPQEQAGGGDAPERLNSGLPSLSFGPGPQHGPARETCKPDEFRRRTRWQPGQLRAPRPRHREAAPLPTSHACPTQPRNSSSSWRGSVSKNR
jgi:membrane protein DedA with SNARE-associated domain